MTFNRNFGQIRSLCSGQPSQQIFKDLMLTSLDMYFCDSEQFSEVIYPYVIEHIYYWPESVTQDWPDPHDAEATKSSSILFCERLELMIDDGFDIQSDFVRDYCIKSNSTLCPESLDGANELPLNLSKLDRYDYELNDNYHKFYSLYTSIRKLLVRYLMSYEQNESWERLYLDYVENGQWKCIPRLGDVGPQHGLFESELNYIQKSSGFRFPKVIYEFYRLFGRLSGHAVGNVDTILSPYGYLKSNHRINNGHILFLIENQGGWGWGYKLSNNPNPSMLWFDDFEEDESGYKKSKMDESFKHTDWCYKYDFGMSFSEFICTDRYPFEPDLMLFRRL